MAELYDALSSASEAEKKLQIKKVCRQCIHERLLLAQRLSCCIDQWCLPIASAERKEGGSTVDHRHEEGGHT